MNKDLKKYWFITASLMLSSGTIILAQEKQVSTYSFSLQQSIDYAFQNQASVLNSALDREIAQKKINELIGIGLPQISSEFYAQKFLEIPTTFVPGEFFDEEAGTFVPVQFGQSYTAAASATATQLIFDGTYLVGLQASKTYAELAQKNYQQAKIEAAALVSKNYYSVLVIEERLKLTNVNVGRLKKLRDDTKALFENGFVEKVDLDRIDVNYNNVLSEKERVERILEMSKAALKNQLGMEISSNLILTDTLTEIVIDANSITNQVDYSKRIEYSILQSNKKLMEMDLKKNRFQYFPSIAAYGSFSYNASRNDFDIFDTKEKWFPVSVVGAKISLPIFDGAQKRSRINQSKLELQKIENGFQLLENNISFDAINAKTSLLNALTTLETQRKNRELAEDVTRISKIKYEQGVGSNLEVVDAESSLREAEGNYFFALLQAYISKIDYQKATGTLINN